MFRSRLGAIRRCAVWTLAFALSLNGAPTLSAQDRSDDPLHDVCTATGAARSAPGDSAPHDSTHRHSHCASCVVRGANPAAPAPSPSAVFLVFSIARHEGSAATDPAVPEFRSNPPAPPRAPPLSS